MGWRGTGRNRVGWIHNFRSDACDHRTAITHVQVGQRTALSNGENRERVIEKEKGNREKKTEREREEREREERGRKRGVPVGGERAVREKKSTRNRGNEEGSREA